MSKRPFLAFVLGLLAATSGAGEGQGATPNRWGYAYPRTYDAEIAAPEVHRLRYEDDHIQFIEVANPPGYAMKMHGHRYPSVFARMSGRTAAGGPGPTEHFLEPAGTRNGQNWRNAPAPQGMDYPVCTAADPQTPHVPTNNNQIPLHFYRIEYKRIDQDGPVGRPSRHGPIARLRYDSAATRLTEITIPPGGDYNARAPFAAAVLAFDTEAAFAALDQAVGAEAGRSAAPVGMAMPRCITLGPTATVPVHNGGPLPLHFYRIDFKRIDGAALAEHWREWYPFMARMR